MLDTNIYGEILLDTDMDIVVSEDEKTMLTENAIHAYRLVNGIFKTRTPQFIGYENKMLLGGS